MVTNGLGSPGGIYSRTMRLLLLSLVVLATSSASCRTGSFMPVGDHFEEIKFPQERVEEVEKDVVVAEGHWRQTRWAGYADIPAVNFVSIRCNKLDGTCHERRADLQSRLDRNPVVPGSFLFLVDAPEFRILSWVDGTVVARAELPVADLDLLISTKDKVAERSFRETRARGSDSADPSISRVYVLE